MNRVGIKKWLLDKGLSQVDIAKRLGLTTSVISDVIRGERTSRRIYECLLEIGCPERFLRKKIAAAKAATKENGDSK
jgi:predicted transcriptional regulator